jgi:hypothetical protein
VGIEIVLMWIGIGIAGGFVVDKSVDLIKHSKTIGSDKYESCVKNAESVKECRNLE